MAGRSPLRWTVRAARAAARRGKRAVRDARRRCAAPALRLLPVAAAERLAVHDGATLDVLVRLPRSAAARPDAVDLVLTRDGREITAPLRLDGSHAAGCVPLGALASDGPGLWRVDLRVRGDDGGAYRRAVYGPVAAAVEDGPTRAPVRCPVTGTRYRPGTSPFGRARVAVAEPGPCALVTRVTTGWDGVTVTGRVLPPVDGVLAAELELVRGDARVRLPVTVEDGRFAVAVPAATLADGVPGGGADWRLALLAPGLPRLPLGRHLHDLPRPDRAIRHPARLIPVAPGRALRVRPRYSARGALLLGCAASEDLV